MGRFNMWLANVMRGRYGMDNLNRAIMIATFILIVINMFVRSQMINFAVVILLIYIYCRMFSRNVNARYAENQKFLQFESAIKRKFGRGGSGYSSTGGFRKGAAYKDRTHKILRCPSCGEKLRVPKGAGKISITCPHCNTKFIKKV